MPVLAACHAELISRPMVTFASNVTTDQRYFINHWAIPATWSRADW